MQVSVLPVPLPMYVRVCIMFPMLLCATAVRPRVGIPPELQGPLGQPRDPGFISPKRETDDIQIADKPHASQELGSLRTLCTSAWT